MGGVPPFGYRVEGRRLGVIDSEDPRCQLARPIDDETFVLRCN